MARVSYFAGTVPEKIDDYNRFNGFLAALLYNGTGDQLRANSMASKLDQSRDDALQILLTDMSPTKVFPGKRGLLETHRHHYNSIQAKPFAADNLFDISLPMNMYLVFFDGFRKHGYPDLNLRTYEINPGDLASSVFDPGLNDDARKMLVDVSAACKTVWQDPADKDPKNLEVHRLKMMNELAPHLDQIPSLTENNNPR